MQIVKGPTPTPSQRLAFELLRPVIQLLRAWGVPENVIRAQSEQAYRRCAQRIRSGVRRQEEPLAALARATGLWSRDSRFLDASGSPRRLRLGRGPGSFAALLRVADVSLRAREALAYLEALGVARRCDQGRRVRLVSRLPLNSAEALSLAAPVLEAVRWLAEPAESGSYARPSTALERVCGRASCARVDPRRLPELRRFVRLLGETFVEAVEEKLLACTLRTSRGGGAHEGRLFGVSIHVYTDPDAPSADPPGRRPSHRS